MIAVAPAIVAGAVGSVLVAIGLSAATPRGLARRLEIDPGVRIDAVVLVAGTVAVVTLGAVLLVVVTRRAVRRPSFRPSASSACRAASAPPACSASPWRPARSIADGWRLAAPSWRPRSASPACSACGRSSRPRSPRDRRQAVRRRTPIWRGAASRTTSPRPSNSLRRTPRTSAFAGVSTPISSSPDRMARRRSAPTPSRPSPVGPGRRSSAARAPAGTRRGGPRIATSSTSSASTSTTRCRSAVRAATSS